MNRLPHVLQLELETNAHVRKVKEALLDSSEEKGLSWVINDPSLTDGRSTSRVTGSKRIERSQSPTSGYDPGNRSPRHDAGDGCSRRIDGCLARVTASSPRAAAAVRLKLGTRVMIVVIRFHRNCTLGP